MRYVGVRSKRNPQAHGHLSGGSRAELMPPPVLTPKSLQLSIPTVKQRLVNHSANVHVLIENLMLNEANTFGVGVVNVHNFRDIRNRRNRKQKKKHLTEPPPSLLVCSFARFLVCSPSVEKNNRSAGATRRSPTRARSSSSASRIWRT